MADASYQPKVYRKQGGDELVVASGGTITVESGGTLALEDGATLSSSGDISYENVTIISTGTLTNEGTIANEGALTNPGTITNSSDGQFIDSLTTASTEQVLPAYGASLIGSTADATTMEYGLNRPGTAGVRKTLVCRTASSTGTVSVISATAAGQVCKFHRTLTKLIFKTSAASGMALDLIGETSTSWSIVGYSTAAATYTCT